MKKFYFVGNAHLDPVWMWRWQEGSAEAKATVRSALDRMKEYPDFKFVCSSASVYRWIEDFDPAMFEEIRARIREGRWIVVGGWFVQPDCNLPQSRTAPSSSPPSAVHSTLTTAKRGMRNALHRSGRASHPIRILRGEARRLESSDPCGTAAQHSVTVILENNHVGTLSDHFRGIECSAPNVQISAIKRAEDGCGTVLRLYETEGHQTECTVSGALLPAPLSATVTPWSVVTYYLPDSERTWKEVLLTEFNM
ncbi:MAG: hypothetical protein IJX80_08680 [Clostridia bacterium]|nr:hypothetical protein [Clostridia bacterium]